MKIHSENSVNFSHLSMQVNLFNNHGLLNYTGIGI